MKDVFFLLFVFAIGLRTGAEFFRGLRSSALPQLTVIATLIITAVVLTWGIARIWESGSRDSCGSSVRRVDEFHVAGHRHRCHGRTRRSTPRPAIELAHNATTAYALTYVVGLISVVGFLSYVAPRLMRVDLKASSHELEQSLGMNAKGQSMNSAYRPILVRGYRLPGRT
jgi:putative transport protein